MTTCQVIRGQEDIRFSHNIILVSLALFIRLVILLTRNKATRLVWYETRIGGGKELTGDHHGQRLLSLLGQISWFSVGHPW